MIHAIIYGKREGVLDFYEATPRFPAEQLPRIESVCSRVGAGFSREQRKVALRYAPVPRGYMLNVMMRSAGDAVHEQRVHWNVVTYLLDEEAATRFFLQPWQEARRQAEELSAHLLRDYHGMALPENLDRMLIGRPQFGPVSDDVRIPMKVLLRAAMYGRGELKSSRLFLQVPGGADRELSALLQELPVLLRKDISFHTDVCFPEDSFGVGICCCTVPTLERLENDGFSGCEFGNIYFHYSAGMPRKNRTDDRQTEMLKALMELRRRVLRFDILQFAIRDWDTYLSLAEAMRGRNFLREVVKRLGEEDLEQSFRIAQQLGVGPLSQTELKRLLSVMGGKKNLKKRLRSQRRSGGMRVWLARLSGGWKTALLWTAALGAAVIAVLLQGQLLQEPSLWKSAVSMVLMFAAGAVVWSACTKRN